MAKPGKKGKRLQNPPKDKATRAVVGQLAKSADRLGRSLGKQSRKLDRQTERTLDSMDQLIRRQRTASGRLASDALAQRASYGTAAGAADKRVASGTATRKFTTTASKAQKSVAKGTAKAAKQALDQAHRTGAKVSVGSMSLLNVLSHQYESQFQHDILMQQLAFDNSVAMAKFQNELQKDYLDYQYEQGYVETPDEKRADDWKYTKKGMLLDDKLLDARAKKQEKEEVVGPTKQAFNAALQVGAAAQAQYWQSLPDMETAAALGKDENTIQQELLGTIGDSVKLTAPAGLSEQAINRIVSTVVENKGSAGSIREAVIQAVVADDATGERTKFIEQNADVMDRWLSKSWAIEVAPNADIIRAELARQYELQGGATPHTAPQSGVDAISYAAGEAASYGAAGGVVGAGAGLLGGPLAPVTVPVGTATGIGVGVLYGAGKAALESLFGWGPYG